MGIISLINGIVDSNIDVMLDKADDPVKDIRLNQTLNWPVYNFTGDKALQNVNRENRNC